MTQRLFFVDVEASGRTPMSGQMTEFGIVAYPSLESIHIRLWDTSPDPDNPAIPVIAPDAEPYDHYRAMGTAAAWVLGWLKPDDRAVAVSDNPAYDLMWLNCYLDQYGAPAVFGHSARRIGDLYAGLERRPRDTSSWKSLRRTRHDHNPVNDAMGNAEAWTTMLMKHGVDRAR